MSEEFNKDEFPPSESDYERRVESEVVHIEEEEITQGEGDLGGDTTEGSLTEQELQEAEAEAEAERLREERRKAREANPFWQFISGNWLILEGVTGTYRYILIVALSLFLSVVSIFYSFHLSDSFEQREKSVQLLRERCLEYQRVRFNKTSHSAIVKELKRRNIQLYDVQESKTVIE